MASTPLTPDLSFSFNTSHVWTTTGSRWDGLVTYGKYDGTNVLLKMKFYRHIYVYGTSEKWHRSFRLSCNPSKSSRGFNETLLGPSKFYGSFVKQHCREGLKVKGWDTRLDPLSTCFSNVFLVDDCGWYFSSTGSLILFTRPYEKQFIPSNYLIQIEMREDFGVFFTVI